jgi:hypothetical protein
MQNIRKFLVVMKVAATMGLYFLAGADSVQARDEGLEDSGLRFVQSFYDWYTSLAASDEKTVSPLETALDARADSFDTTLLEALRRNLAAQKSSPEEVVGLDFDPFLNSQDSAEQYNVGEISNKNDRYFVTVYATGSAEKLKTPAVTAELQRKGDNWIFVDFHYGEESDLMSELKQLEDGRKKK